MKNAYISKAEIQKKYSSKCFYTVFDWMKEKFPYLNLRERTCYAIIYGFSQDGQSVCHADNAWLAYHCDTTPRTVSDMLKKLMEKGLVIRIEERTSTGVRYSYKANLDMVYSTKVECDDPKEESSEEKEDSEGGVEKISRGCRKNFYGGVEKNSSIYIYTNIDTNNTISSSDNETTDHSENGCFGENDEPKKKPKKSRTSNKLTLEEYEKCITDWSSLNNYTISEDLMNTLREWYSYKADKKQAYASSKGITSLMNKIKDSGLPDTYVINSFVDAMSANYAGVFFDKAIREYNKTKENNFNYGNSRFNDTASQNMYYDFPTYGSCQ